MRPMSDINVGDQYERGYPFELIWNVVAVDPKEKMVQIEAFGIDGKRYSLPLWKKNTSSIFRRRIFNGKTKRIGV